MEERADVDAERDGLAVYELLTSLVFERIEEEVVNSLDVTRVPTIAVIGRAPAQAVEQHDMLRRERDAHGIAPGELYQPG